MSTRRLSLLLALAACTPHDSAISQRGEALADIPLADVADLIRVLQFNPPTAFVGDLPISPLPWLALPADAAIAGKIHDPHGAAIRGAHVCAWHGAPDRLREEDRGPRCTTTDRDGRYAILDLVSATWHVHASAPMFLPSFRAPIAVRPEARLAAIDLTLEPGGVPLRGRVVDLRGASIPGAWVTNFTVEDLGRDALESVPTAAQTDADGRFTLWLAHGEHVLHADAAKFTRTTVHQNTLAPPIDIHLGPESVITGTVLDATTRTPIPGARVFASHEATAYTDDAGRFRLNRLPPGVFEVHAETGSRAGAADREVVLGLAQTYALPPIVASSVPSLRARIIGCTRGEVFTYSSRDPTHLIETIDPLGEVFFPALEPGRQEFHISCDRHRSSSEEVTIFHAPAPTRAWSPGPHTPAKLVADEQRPEQPGEPDRGHIRGVVVDTSGRPFASADVTLWDGSAFFENRTDDIGSFSFFDVVVGDYDLVAADSNFRPNEAPTRAITVTHGAVSKARFVLPDDRAPILGRVVRGGVPLVGAVVVARRIDPIDHTLTRLWDLRDTITTSDASGRFRIPAARRDELHEIWAYPLGGGAGTIAQATAATDVTIEVLETATISGALPGTSPEPFVVGLITIGDEGERELADSRSFRRTAGRWGFEAVPPGTYEVRLVSASACATAQVTVGPHERREDVALTLTPPVRLRGQALDERARKPVSGHYVRYSYADPLLADLHGQLRHIDNGTTDASGRFELPALCPGELDVSVQNDRREHTERVRLTSVPPPDITLSVQLIDSD